MDNDRRARRTDSRTNRHTPANEMEPPSWLDQTGFATTAQAGDAA